MTDKSQHPETLQALVTDALSLLSVKMKNQWSCEFDRNRARFQGPGPEFSVRDKDGFFTITYEYKPNTKTTRHYQHEQAVRFMIDLFHRPQIGKSAG